MATLTEIARIALEVDSEEYLNLIEKSTELLAAEKGQIGRLSVEGRLVRAEPSGEAIIIGDVHGDLESLVYMLKTSEFMEKASRGTEVLLVFLGDYGDRGPYSPEVYYVVLGLKRLFPQKVVLMRGNHEGPDDLLAYPHDLPENMRERFGKGGVTVYSEVRKLFQHLHTTVLVEGLCVMIHGGVPSGASRLEDLAYAHSRHPKEKHLEGMLWNDPTDDLKGTYPSPRGAGMLFGEDVTKQFLDLLGVKMLIRGHEPAQNGFKINHNGKVLTLFSRRGAPYFNSSAAYLQFDFSAKPRNAYELEPYIRKF